MKVFLKRIVLLSALLIFSIGCSQLKSSAPTQQKPQTTQKVIPSFFKLQCRAVLNPDSNPIIIKAEPPVFTVADFSTDKARTSISIGPFTLISKVIEETRDHEFVLPRTFCVDIYNGNFSEPALCEKGFDLTSLFNGDIGLPASSGSGFIVDFVFQNQKISYLSFNCDLIDAEEN